MEASRRSAWCGCRCRCCWRAGLAGRTRHTVGRMGAWLHLVPPHVQENLRAACRGCSLFSPLCWFWHPFGLSALLLLMRSSCFFSYAPAVARSLGTRDSCGDDDDDTNGAGGGDADHANPRQHRAHVLHDDRANPGADHHCEQNTLVLVTAVASSLFSSVSMSYEVPTLEVYV